MLTESREFGFRASFISGVNIMPKSEISKVLFFGISRGSETCWVWQDRYFLSIVFCLFNICKYKTFDSTEKIKTNKYLIFTAQGEY